MTVEFLENRYSHLNDIDDAQLLFGKCISKGRASIGDVRRATIGHPKSASIRLENDGSGFYIVDYPGKFSCA